MSPAHLRAFVVLTADLVRRFLREGIVLRSLIFPVGLAVTALVSTVGVVLWLQPPLTLAITPELATAELVDAVQADGWPVIVVDDPGAMVVDGDAALGSDGHTIWVGNGGNPPLSMEGHLRRSLGTVWRPDQPRAVRARAIRESDAPGRLAVFIGALFTMYGVVFGAGSVARDRDEGTLDAELSMPVPHLVHGLARWAAGSLVLGGFFAFSVYLLHAIMGIPEAPELAVKGAAAASASTAIGLIVVGGSGLKRGFAGALSTGLVAVFGCLAFGFALPAVGSLLPIASLVIRAAPAAPSAVGALVLGGLAAWSFARRTAVS